MEQVTDNVKQPVTGVIHELQHAASQYLVITANEDMIRRTGEQIVLACQLQISASAWKQNFDLTVDHVHEWCRTRADRIVLALVGLRTDKTVFYIVPRSDQYDFDLGMEQADLDIFLNTRGGIGYAETRQVPAWELDRFVKQAFLVFSHE